MTDQPIPGLIGRLLRHLRASMATIEQQHKNAQCGWDIYVRDIFVAHHLQQSARRASQKRKPWQMAKRTENPAP
jgi:hypothetical protein